MSRILAWFSCGAPSAVAARLAVSKYGKSHEVIVVNCDTRPSEHVDNYRFSADCERWFGQPITFIRSSDYRTVDEVFEKEKYMSGVKGARCTTELKKVPRLAFARADDIHVFGLALNEVGRIRKFERNNPDLFLKWILVEERLTTKDCHKIIEDDGIEPPMMYRLGFDNNNCPGCVILKVVLGQGADPLSGSLPEALRAVPAAWGSIGRTSSP